MRLTDAESAFAYDTGRLPGSVTTRLRANPDAVDVLDVFCRACFRNPNLTDGGHCPADVNQEQT